MALEDHKGVLEVDRHSLGQHCTQLRCRGHLVVVVGVGCILVVGVGLGFVWWWFGLDVSVAGWS